MVFNILYQIGRLLEKKGKSHHAIAFIRLLVHLKPDILKAQMALGRLLIREKRLSEAVKVYKCAVEANPNKPLIHKELVDVLIASSGIEEAFRFYKLDRKDSNQLHFKKTDILCCVVVRNESLRLPYFLSYYRSKGISKFLIVDNDSTDGTLSLLLAQTDVHVWHTPFSFNQANFGAGWFEVLLRKFGQNCWCLIVDADEIFYYPDCEKFDIPHLCNRLDQENKKAVSAILLDMYSDKSIQETNYQPGQNFFDVCPFFDKTFYHRTTERAGPWNNQTYYWGGLRQRIFGGAGNFCLSKVPLIKYDSDILLAGGQHSTNIPQWETASQRGALLHFKYFSTFPAYVKQEVERKQHWNKGVQYIEYQRGLERNRPLQLFHPEHSIRFEDGEQLLRLGIMHRGKDLGSPSPARSELSNSLIRSVSSGMKRPYWSVMVTVYDRVQFLRQALRSILLQDPGEEDMQIEVIQDGGLPEVQVEIEKLVKEIGDGRIQFYCNPFNVGHPEIFNVCLNRAQGHWIHVLHDDDWIEPGFYASLRQGIESANHVGAAYCRHYFADEKGMILRMSGLERDTPGVLDDWPERIGVRCRVQTPAMVVKRKVYERLGGFSFSVGSTFDWEMWKRIAVEYPVWYEPQPLASFREHAKSESARLKKSGAQIGDIHKCIEFSKGYFSGKTFEHVSERAKWHYGSYALNLAKQQFKMGEFKAALCNFREALKFRFVD